jgi:hypothetical protein
MSVIRNNVAGLRAPIPKRAQANEPDPLIID